MLSCNIAAAAEDARQGMLEYSQSPNTIDRDNFTQIQKFDKAKKLGLGILQLRHELQGEEYHHANDTMMELAGNSSISGWFRLGGIATLDCYCRADISSVPSLARHL